MFPPTPVAVTVMLSNASCAFALQLPLHALTVCAMLKKLLVWVAGGEVPIVGPLEALSL